MQKVCLFQATACRPHSSAAKRRGSRQVTILCWQIKLTWDHYRIVKEQNRNPQQAPTEIGSHQGFGILSHSQSVSTTRNKFFVPSSFVTG